MKSIEQQMLHRIDEKSRVGLLANRLLPSGQPRYRGPWAARMHKKGTVRRAIRGIYDYPHISALLVHGQKAAFGEKWANLVIILAEFV
jgi:hypothetical protein